MSQSQWYRYLFFSSRLTNNTLDPARENEKEEFVKVFS